jgi:hypothetical protein
MAGTTLRGSFSAGNLFTGGHSLAIKKQGYCLDEYGSPMGIFGVDIPFPRHCNGSRRMGIPARKIQVREVGDATVPYFLSFSFSSSSLDA